MQLSTYTKALQARATLDSPESLTPEFWLEYKRILLDVFSDESKQTRAYLDLRETAHRLFLQSKGNSQSPSSSTKWISEDTLCFTPSLIDPHKILEEQRASFHVMHDKTCARRIHIVVDMRQLTFGHATLLTKFASQDNITDGLRLWSTLPRNVDKVTVVRPASFPPLLLKILINFSKLWMSSKILKRLELVDSYDHICNNNRLTSSSGSN